MTAIRFRLIVSQVNKSIKETELIGTKAAQDFKKLVQQLPLEHWSWTKTVTGDPSLYGNGVAGIGELETLGPGILAVGVKLGWVLSSGPLDSLGKDVFDWLFVFEELKLEEGEGKKVFDADWIGKPLGTPPVAEAVGTNNPDDDAELWGTLDLDTVKVITSGVCVGVWVTTKNGVFVFVAVTLVATADLEACGVLVFVIVQIPVYMHWPATQESAVHGLLSLHIIGVFTHFPDEHVSIVQAFPSSQFGGLHCASTLEYIQLIITTIIMVTLSHLWRCNIFLWFSSTVFIQKY